MGWLTRLETKAVEETFTPINAQFDPPFLPLTRINYGREIRGGLDSNVLMSPIQWIMRAFPEAVPVVEQQVGERPWKRMPQHALTRLLRKPNPFINGACLFQATVLSYVMDGNGYWLKRRNEFGMVVEYWYIPHWMIEPRWLPGGQNFIDWYDYQPMEGLAERLAPEDVVHFRFGIDPRNTRKGWSQIKTLMREIYTDEQAANFSAAILKNQGVPGMMVAPKSADAMPTPDDVEEVKRELDGRFSGDRRGSTLVMSAPTDVIPFGFDPNRLDMSRMRDVSEERVCAALGLPAAVVGFGTGLQSTKVGATMKEMRRMAWSDCINPLQSSLGMDMDDQVVPDFESLAHRWRVRFDTSEVSAFKEEETEKATRIKTLVGAGVMRVDQAQEAAGLEVDESQRVYLRPTGTVPVEEGDPGLEAGATPAGTPQEAPDEERQPASLDEVMAEAAKAIATRRARVSNGNQSGT